MIQKLDEIEECVAYTMEIEVSLVTRVTLSLITKSHVDKDEAIEILSTAAVDVCTEEDNVLHMKDISKNLPYSHILAINEDAGYKTSVYQLPSKLPPNIKNQIIKGLNNATKRNKD